MAKRIKKLTSYLAFICIAIFGFVIYFNSLRGKFVWDDELLIIKNLYIKDWSWILNIFRENTGSGSLAVSSFYRPFQIFTYLVDYSVWKLNVIGYHLTNIFLHILVAFMIYRLIRSIFNDKRLSLLTSLLFVAHPVHSEAIAYISGRQEPLSALFMLLCLILYIKNQRSKNNWSYFFMLLSYLLALFSKENALIFPALLLLYHYTFKEKIKVELFAPFLGIFFFYLLIRLTMLHILYQGINIMIKRVPGFFVAITNYLAIIILPRGLHADYGNMFFRFTDPKALFGLLAASFLMIYSFKRRRQDKLTFFSVWWFFIALLPSTSIYPVNAFYMSDHWLYFPSIGFFLVIANLLTSLYRNNKFRPVAVVLIACLLIFYAYSTIKQNSYWNDPIAFYERTLRYAPNSTIAHCNLGNEYLAIGERQKAIEEFKKAIAIDPKKPLAYYNLGVVFQRAADKDKSIGGYKQALAQYQKAIENNPNYAEAYNNICEIHIATGENEEAIKSCKKAIGLSSRMATAYYNLGNAYYNLGQKEKSIEAERKAIELDPSYVEAYNNLASTYSEMGKIDEAIGLWNKAIKIDPNFVVAHFNLAVFYYQKKQFDQAIMHCDKVIAIGGKVDPAFLQLLKPYRK